MKSILGWLVQMGDDPLHPDSFHLADPNTGKKPLTVPQSPYTTH